jgi:hypothetical protein
MVRCIDVQLACELKGEVTVVVTRLPSLKPERINQYRSPEHLCDALLASAACIPLGKTELLCRSDTVCG